MAKYLALAVVLSVTLVVMAADEKKPDTKPDAKPEPVRKFEKWEYAELYSSTLADRARGFAGKGGQAGGGPGAAQPGAGQPGAAQPGAAQPGAFQPRAKAKTPVRWTTSEGETEGDNWGDLASKLKAPAAAKDATVTAQRIKLLNYLGSQGWELVSRDTTVWTFKRKITK